NANCTGSAVVTTPNSPVPLRLSLVIVKDGKEFRTILDASSVGAVYSKIEYRPRGDLRAGQAGSNCRGVQVRPGSSIGRLTLQVMRRWGLQRGGWTGPRGGGG